MHMFAKKPAELVFSSTDREHEAQILPSEQLHVIPYSDYLSVLEEEIKIRWCCIIQEEHNWFIRG